MSITAEALPVWLHDVVVACLIEPGARRRLQFAAVHAEAESAPATDWRQSVALYNQLVRIQPSPVVHFGRAVAIAEGDGPAAGRTHIDALLEHSNDYWRIQFVQSCTAGSAGPLEARASYEKALALTQPGPERQFLRERIRQSK